MERKKALIVVAGGRGQPDFLALFCVRPNLVAIITSYEGWNEEDFFKDAASAQPQLEEILPTQQVPSYKMSAVKEICLQLCNSYPKEEWEWTISIGSCPKVMGIGAYEAAKELNIPCVFMDSQHEEVVSLVRSLRSIPQNIFHLKVDDYLKIYGRVPNLPSSKSFYRKKVETWGEIAQSIALSSAGALFTRSVRGKKAGSLIDFPDASSNLSRLLSKLENFGAINILRQKDGLKCEFTTDEFAAFLGTGTWLELYVWSEVKKKAFADDCQWGYPIKSLSKDVSKGHVPNELDGVIVYKSQLLLVECKTGSSTFKGDSHYLDLLNDKADMLGRSYVTKVFVTNEDKAQSSYADFSKRAEIRQIVVITAEDLPEVGSIFEQEATNPRYKRR